jgi:hypothetical protein
MTVTLPSAPMRKNALGANTAAPALAASARRAGPNHSKPIVSAIVVTEPAVFRNSRRVGRIAASDRGVMV